MGTEEELKEIIAEAIYEANNEGTWENASEKTKKFYCLEAGFVSEAILEKWVGK